MADDDNEFSTATSTGTLQITVEEQLVIATRMEKVRQQVRMRDWYHEAIDEWVAKREELEGSEGAEEKIRRIYLASPAGREGRPVMRISVTVDEDRMNAVKDWAEEDERNYSDALYSALLPMFERVARRLRNKLEF